MNPELERDRAELRAAYEEGLRVIRRQFWVELTAWVLVVGIGGVGVISLLEWVLS